MKNIKKIKPLIYVSVVLLSLVVYNLMFVYFAMKSISGSSEAKMIQTLIINMGYNFGISFLVPYYFKQMIYAVPFISVICFLPTWWLFYGGIGLLYWIIYIFAALIGTVAAKGYLFKESTGMVIK